MGGRNVCFSAGPPHHEPREEVGTGSPAVNPPPPRPPPAGGSGTPPPAPLCTQGPRRATGAPPLRRRRFGIFSFLSPLLCCGGRCCLASATTLRKNNLHSPPSTRELGTLMADARAVARCVRARTHPQPDRAGGALAPQRTARAVRDRCRWYVGACSEMGDGRRPRGNGDYVGDAPPPGTVHGPAGRGRCAAGGGGSGSTGFKERKSR